MTLERNFSVKFRGYNTNMAKEVIFLISIAFVRSEFLAVPTPTQLHCSL